jgi:hypothetical protein
MSGAHIKPRIAALLRPFDLPQNTQPPQSGSSGKLKRAKN